MTDREARGGAEKGLRLPASYLAAEYLAHGVSTVGSVIAVVVFLMNPNVWPGPWIVVVFAAIFVFRMVEPLYERGTTRILLSPRDISVTTGLLNRRTRTIRWQAVRTIDSTAPWAHRLFGLVRVQIAQGGDLSTRVTLAGITREMQDEILAHSPVPDTGDLGRQTDAAADGRQTDAVTAPAPRAAASATPAPAPQPAGGDLLYRATLGDLVFASILFGRFAVVGVAIAFALFEQLENLGLLGVLLSLQGVGAVGFAGFVALMIVAVGIAASVVRYARLEVRRLAGGGIGISYGLVETRERVIDAAAITGVVLHRNLLEMALGRARLALLTADTGQLQGGNLLLPSLPRRTVARILADGFAGRVPQVTLASRGRLPLRSGLLFAAVTGVAAALGWSLHAIGLALGLAILAGLVVWGLLPLMLRPLVTRFDFDDDARILSLRTLLIAEREIHLGALAVHFVHDLAFLGRTRALTVHYFAGEARQRSGIRFDPQAIEVLRNRLGDRELRMARVRSAREHAALRREALDEIDALVGAP